MKKFLTIIIFLLFCSPLYAAKDFATRYATGTAMEVYTPNNPLPGGGSGNVGIGTSGNPAYYPSNGSTVAPFINVHYVGSNVGIGSANPGQVLDVQGTTRTTGFTLSGNSATTGYVLTATDNAGDATWSPSSGGGGSSFWVQSPGNVGINTTQNVGIGTVSPIGLFQVVGGGNTGIGTTNPGTTLDVGGTVRALTYVNSWTNITSASCATSDGTFSAISSYTCTGLVPGAEYLLIIDVTSNTSAGSPQIRFNSDSGNNYLWQDLIGHSSAAIATAYQAVRNAVNIDSQRSIVVGAYGHFAVYFHTVPGTNSTVIVSSTGNFESSGDSSHYIVDEVSGLYTGASTLSSVSLIPDAGTFTGSVVLMQAT